MAKKALFWILIVAGCLFMGARGRAQGLADSYHVVLPGSGRDMSYACEEPAFRIRAPKDWYMATATDKDVTNKAIFFKADPRKALAEDDIPMPNICVSLEGNLSGAPLWAKAAEQAGYMKTDGGAFLLEPEPITVGKETGYHFTALDPVSKAVMDIYIFQKGEFYIRIMAICPDTEFEGLKVDIKQTVDSIVL